MAILWLTKANKVVSEAQIDIINTISMNSSHWSVIAEQNETDNDSEPQSKSEEIKVENEAVSEDNKDKGNEAVAVDDSDVPGTEPDIVEDIDSKETETVKESKKSTSAMKPVSRTKWSRIGWRGRTSW